MHHHFSKSVDFFATSTKQVIVSVPVSSLHCCQQEKVEATEMEEARKHAPKEDVS